MLEILLAGGGKAGPVAIPAVHRARPCPVLGLFLYVWVFFILFFLFGRVVVVVGLAASLRTGCRFVKGVSCVRGQTQWTVVVVWGPRSLSLSLLLAVASERWGIGALDSPVRWIPVWCAVREPVLIVLSVLLLLLL